MSSFINRKPLQGFLVFIIVLSCIFLLVTCEEETSVPREYPRITGVEITNISDSGATFVADLYSYGTEKILDHGFAWGTFQSLDPNSSERVLLGVPAGAGIFKADIRSSLVEGKEYFVRPFVQTEVSLVVGPVVKFTSLGSMAPVITGFSPDSLRWGDTLTINGKYFSFLTNEIFLNDVKCDQVSSTDKVIKAKVSSDIVTRQNTISVSVIGNKSSFTNEKVNIIFPAINELNKTTALWKDSITIRGRNLSFFRQNRSNFIMIGNINCPAGSITDSTINIAVPESLNTIESLLTMRINKLILGPLPFRLKAPSLTGLSTSSAFWGESVIIQGKYLKFFQDKTSNAVMIGGVKCLTGAITDSTISITVPLTVSTAENNLSVIINDLNIGSIPFNLKKPYFQLTVKEGTWGSKTWLKGRFHPDRVKNSVSIGGINASINQFTTDSMLVTVPNGVRNRENQVKLTSGGFPIISPESFIMYEPVITSVTPLEGRYPLKVTIRGKYLSDNHTYGLSRLGFGSMFITSFYELSDTLVEFRVPYEYYQDKAAIVMYAGNQSTTWNKDFVMKLPLFTGCSPMEASFGDTITFTGKNLAPYSDYFFINFGNEVTNPFFINDTVAKSIVPNTIDSLDRIIIAGDGSIPAQTVTELFRLKPPEITGISPGITSAGQDITLSGNGFNPNKSLNKVLWDNFPLSIISSTKNQIVARLPDILPGNDPLIRLATGGYLRSLVVENQIQSKWSHYLINNKIISWRYEPLYLGNRANAPVAFTLNGKAYFMDPYGSLLCYDPLTKSMEQTGTYSFLAGKTFQSVVCDNKAYIISENTSLYMFNTGSKTWTPVTGSPMSGSKGAFFSLGGKIYYGLTMEVISSNSYRISPQLWEFDPDLNSWSLKCANYLFMGPVANSFSMGGKGYVRLSDNRFIEYDPVDDSWTQLASYPLNPGLSGTTELVINDKAYIGLGASWYFDTYFLSSDNHFYMYDRVSNSWSQMMIPFGGRYNAAATVVNNKGYIFGGIVPYTSYPEMFEFDPSL